MEWSEIHAHLTQDLNDAPAWNALNKRVRGWAARALRQLGPDIVDDVVADTCSTIAVNFGRARGAQTFRGFVLGTFWNERRRVLRQREPSITPLDGVEVAAPESRSELDKHYPPVLLSGLATLKERERQALLLRFVEDCSTLEVATALGVQPGNVRRILSEGRARLRKYVTGHSGARQPERV
jgi:RNA polymerase sigma factor (sigma-70 family)